MTAKPTETKRGVLQGRRVSSRSTCGRARSTTPGETKGASPNDPG